jgi:predicted ester cyclase
MKGTQRGEFMGIAATGKTISVSTIDIVRFIDGKAVEHWGVTDGLTMMDQLGAHPETA